MGSQLKGKCEKKKRWAVREVAEMQRVAGSELFGSLVGGEKKGRERGENGPPFFDFQMIFSCTE